MEIPKDHVVLAESMKMEPSLTTKPPLEQIEVLSLARLESLVTDVGAESPVVFRKLLEIFTREAPERINEIRKAVREKAAFELLQSAHSLKSSSGNLGLERLRSLCAFLEERAKQEQLDGLEASIEGIDEVYREGRAALEEWTDGLLARTFP